MAWTKYQIVLAVVLVVTGSINTLSTKWADKMVAAGLDGVLREFNHPFLQASAMFAGEFLCLLAFKFIYYHYWRKQDGSQNENKFTKGNRSFNPLILLPPAMCDMVATSVMYIGLNLTYASSFQMLRGAVIVFVGIFSMIFLRKRLCIREWVGIVFVIAGLAVVGVSDLIKKDTKEDEPSTEDVIYGDLLIIGAQVISAAQMVLEEKYVSGLDIPALQAVGWEGFFGFVTLAILQIPFYYIHVPAPFSNNSTNSLENALEAFTQMANNNLIIVGLLGTVISIAFFNFAGISVTKEISATTRMVLDSVRTLVIWMVSLLLEWQAFHWLQIVGFLLLLLGMALYNNVLVKEFIRFLYMIRDCICPGRRASRAERRDTLVNNPADEPNAPTAAPEHS